MIGPSRIHQNLPDTPHPPQTHNPPPSFLRVCVNNDHRAALALRTKFAHSSYHTHTLTYTLTHSHTHTRARARMRAHMSAYLGARHSEAAEIRPPRRRKRRGNVRAGRQALCKHVELPN